jgi:hypothetical protein
MPRNSSGVYTLPSGNPVVPGTTIDAAWANDTLEDMANEITNSLSRTGAGGMIAPFRIADGNVTTPGLSFLNETNTGLYRSGAGSSWFSVLGVNVMQLSTVGVTIPFGKALTAQGNASVAGTFAVGGAVNMASSLDVQGDLRSNGTIIGHLYGDIESPASSVFNDVVVNGSLDMTAGSSATITGLNAPTNSSDAANKGYVDAQVATRLALTGGTMSGAIAMGNSKITGLGTPTADADAATKAYVDTIAQGLDAKGSCLVASVYDHTLSGDQVIDGVDVPRGSRVLMRNQNSPAQNGIYVTAAGAWSRAADADTWNELISAYTFIEQGDTWANTGFLCTVKAGGTLGVTPVTWVQFSGAGQIDAGWGMYKTGNQLNVGTAQSSRIVVNADNIDLATTGVGVGTYKSVTVDQWGRVTAGTNPTTLSGFGITDAYTTTQVDTALALKLSLTGGTMSGVIAMGANKITGLADPTNSQDAATKSYIDTIFGSTTTAAASAAAAASSATAAATSATNAANSATNAATSATNSANSYTTFNNQYLGSKSSDPATNNSGGALVSGNLYWNSTAGEMRVYTGSTWLAAYLPATGYLALTGGTMTGTINFAAGQTIAGYLTSATAASTYAPLASPTFTGSIKAPYGLFTGGISSYNSSTGAVYLGYSAGGIIRSVADNSGTAAKLGFQTDNSGVDRMLIDTSGNVAIGLSSAAGKFDVSTGVGRVFFSANGSANLLQSANTANSAYADMHINGSTVSLLTAGSTRVTVDAAGNMVMASGSIQEHKTAIAASAIDMSLGNYFSKTISGTTTFTVSNVPATGTAISFILDLTNGGSATVNWWTGVKWAGGTAPTLTSSGRDVLGFFTYDNGTTWNGLVLGKAMA